MCGIVLVGARTMTSKEVGTFEKLLYADTFRGPHSTGVFCRRSIMHKGETHVAVPLYKIDLEGPDYLETSGWIDLGYGYGSGQKFANFYVGHNRWATQGAINATNAHPFKKGNITMVHNGTLMDQSILPDHVQFEVDSENICHSLEKWGVDKTIQNLDGAFTLVWHNAETDTLHIIRNEERPFHLAKTRSGDWFGASEEGMLMWILGRGKLPYLIETHFECEVGKEYIFDVSNGGFDLKEEREHKLPDFLSGYDRWGGYGLGGHGGRSYYRGYRNGNTSNRSGSQGSGVSTSKNNTTKVNDPKKVNKVNEILKSEYIAERMGETLEFVAYSYKEYNVGSENGLVEGFIDDISVYVEVQMHNALKTSYGFQEQMKGKIVGAYHKHSITTVILVAEHEEGQDGNVLPFLSDGERTEISSDIPFNDPLEGVCEESKLTAIGNLTESEWQGSISSLCGFCDEAVPFEKAGTAKWFMDSVVCEECESCIGIAESALSDDEEDEGDSFQCRDCGGVGSKNMESVMSEVCQPCYDWLSAIDISG